MATQCTKREKVIQKHKIFETSTDFDESFFGDKKKLK